MLNDIDQLIPDVYSELKRLAAYHLRFERPNHTLRPTELVHEVYLRLAKQHSLSAADRSYIIRLASTMMRQLLVNHAKSRNRKKRGEGHEKLQLDEVDERTVIFVDDDQLDVLALEEALEQLALRDERQVKIVEMHFYGGLTFQEIADVMQLSLRSVMREWRFARSWLFKRLQS